MKKFANSMKKFCKFSSMQRTAMKLLAFLDNVMMIWHREYEHPMSFFQKLLPTKHGHKIWMSKSGMFGDIFLHNWLS